MHSSASTGMQSRNQLHQVSDRNSRTMVSLPSEVVLAQIWQILKCKGRMVVSLPREIWQIPKSNGRTVVGLPSEELPPEIWQIWPKKQLWQNCMRSQNKNKGKGNADSQQNKKTNSHANSQTNSQANSQANNQANS